MDDSFQLGWNARYPTLKPPPWEKNPTLPGAEIQCGPWPDGKGMCNSKNHKACLFNLADGKFKLLQWNLDLTPGRGYPSKFYTGRLRSEVQTLTLLCTISARKGPLSYIFHRQCYPFHIPTS